MAYNLELVSKINLTISRDASMQSERMAAVAAQAKAIYKENLRNELEQKHRGQYVCISPESGDYFLGATFDDAINSAIDAHPECLTHTLRIGHEAALHLGVLRG